MLRVNGEHSDLTIKLSGHAAGNHNSAFKVAAPRWPTKGSCPANIKQCISTGAAVAVQPSFGSTAPPLA